MRRGRTNPRNAHGGFGGFGKKYIVKRDNAGWKIRPEAADMADRKQFDRALHGDFDLSDLTNARTAHDGPGTDLPKRGNDLLLPPQQRQWHRNHTRPEHAKESDGAFHGVRKLDRHGAVGLQPQAA